MAKTIEIGKSFEYFNFATGDKVVLKVTKAIGIVWKCTGCYFNGKERHCPDEYACGQFARKDNTAVIFKYIGDVKNG